MNSKCCQIFSVAGCSVNNTPVEIRLVVPSIFLFEVSSDKNRCVLICFSTCETFWEKNHILCTFYYQKLGRKINCSLFKLGKKLTLL